MPNSDRKIPRCSNGKTYSDGCRCDFCRQQVAKSMKIYRYRKIQQERGIPSPLDLLDASDYTRRLQEAHVKYGITDREVYMATGLARSVIQRLRGGKTKRIRRETAERLERYLEYPDVRAFLPNSIVDSTWAAQMVRCLCAQGFSVKHQRELIEKHCGIPSGFIPHILNEGKATQYQNVEAIRWLVQAIGNKEGPSFRSAIAMQKRGVFPVKHYNAKGELLISTLSPEQRDTIAGV